MQLSSLACSALILAQLVQVVHQEEIPAEFICSDNKCFAIFWNSKRFAKSSRACEEKNGNLLTVQDKVQEDAIKMFMARAPREDARVWIGLEQQPGTKCTDLQQPLRGFTWVTGGSGHDYINWGQDEQKCDASPLCVTVRKDATWEETICNDKADGFLCEISHSLLCSPVSPSSYIVSYLHLSLGRGNIGDPRAPVFPPGTIATISTDPNFTELYCEAKGDGTGAWTKETPGAWDCQIEKGGCEHECVQKSEGSAECKCPPGSELKGDLRGCSNACDPNPCAQQCVQDSSPLGFSCKCSEGYKLSADGKTCEDIDECKVNPNICNRKHMQCNNVHGSYECVCQPGFELVNEPCDNGDTCGSACKDIDECETNMCEHQCKNQEGSYTCLCDEGFYIDEKIPQKCIRFCNSSECKPDCPDPDKACACPNGYIMDQTEDGVAVCTDIDECDTSDCGELLCVNTFGSYICTCPEGFTEHNGQCIQPTQATSATPSFTPPASRPEDLYALQNTIVWGICSGILCMFIVLIAMFCHRIRRHYIYQHDLDFTYKNTDKDVVLQKIMVEPQW